MAQLVRRHARLEADRSEHWDTDPRVKLVSLGVGLAAFFATELMHYLLVPDIGRRWERWLAETVSALVVALLTARLMHAANQRREAALLRMQVISEMNHHIRNALAAVSLTTDSIQNQQCILVISESVDRIEWALREILLRPKPLPEKEQDRLRYLHSQSLSTTAGQEHTNEYRQSSLR
jgi:signal transduction histidine kinase